MAVRPQLMIGAGIAIAGLGLVGAGAGATYTTQVATKTSISSGRVGLSLNGKTGTALDMGLDGRNLTSHFTPISTTLRLKNTGTLDLASTHLSLTASGCDGGEGAPLAKALQMKLTDATHEDLIYDGALCAFAISGVPQSATGSRAHADRGARLPRSLKTGDVITYRLVVQPADAEQGLPAVAHNARTSVKLVFTGLDY